MVSFFYIFTVEFNDLSTDQQYLLDMCNAISNGFCPVELSNRSPGAISHARWLTTANRVLRVYVSETKPSVNLIKLVKYIVKVYAPSWFAIKTSSSCIDGSKLLHQMILRTQYLKGTDKKIIEKSISWNGFYAHPENILLSMVFDENEDIRSKGIQLIKSAKEESQDNLKFLP